MQISLFVVAVLCFCGGFVLEWMDKTTGGGLVLAAGVLVLIFVFLSRFKRFKGLGVEAELWEEKQEEAAALVERLRRLLLTAFKPTISMMADVGLAFPEGMNRRDRHDWSESIVSQLRSAGASQDEIDEAMRPLNNRIEMEMATVIADGIRACCRKSDQDHQAIERRLESLPAPTAQDREQLALANAERKRIAALRERAQKIGSPENFGCRSEILDEIMAAALTPDQAKLIAERFGSRIEDLRHFARTRTLRNPSEWVTRDWSEERQRAASIIDPNLKHHQL